MKIKGRINFTKLREKGPSAIDIKDDEIIQLVTRGQTIKYIVDSEHYMKLYSSYQSLTNRQDYIPIDKEKNLKSIKSKEVELKKLMNKEELSNHFNNIANLANEDLQFTGMALNSYGSSLSDSSKNTVNLNNIKLDDIETIYTSKGLEIYINKDINTNNYYLVCPKMKSKKDENKTIDHFFLVQTTKDKIEELKNGVNLLKWIKSHFLFLDYTIEYKNYSLPSEIIKQTSFRNLEKEKVLPKKEDRIKKEKDHINLALDMVEKFIENKLEEEYKKDKKNGTFSGGTANVMFKFQQIKKELKGED